MHTDPEILTAFWHDENLTLNPVCPQSLKYMYNTLRDIEFHQMWLGLIYVGMVKRQATYYLQIESRESAKNGVLILFKKCLVLPMVCRWKETIFYIFEQLMVLKA